LILVFGVPVEERLDFQFVDPATQAAPELSLNPKVKAAKSPSQEFQKLFASLHQKVTDNISQHSETLPNAYRSLGILLRSQYLVKNRQRTDLVLRMHFE
jgi:hypothetical protein